ncbi:hypothetical protein APR12_004968 [Nocardia amikacinitolerans]|uniref:DUF6968 family protein n=1 Tax=Nocardia amikacinitolerans TaxID=756689 RepID=UPI000833693E|nr:hypothetical protein [Nocardia amikacinitolerans]MCP2319599.1 hypothetical protein [Nocardia amikacinitolerans]
MTNGLGEPIARRELRKGDDPVIVTIGKPRPSGHGDFACAVRIEGVNDEPLVTDILGIDSVQALVAAMAFAGRFIQSSEGDYTFLGDADLGFPSIG